MSNDQYILYIDDIAYRRAADGLTFVGYNVYRDGKQLTAAPIAEPAYSETMPAGEHNYAVSVVYTTGESILSPATFVSPTGISPYRPTLPHRAQVWTCAPTSKRRSRFAHWSVVLCLRVFILHCQMAMRHKCVLVAVWR